MRFKIDWDTLIVGRKFTVFALFYFVFEGNFQGQAPGGLIFGGAISWVFFALRVWRAYTWRGIFSEFYGIYYISEVNLARGKETLKFSGPYSRIRPKN